MTKVEKISWAVVICLVVMAGAYLFTLIGRGIVNRIDFAVQKVDDATRYETIKKVEDTCRAMMASYEADRLTYTQYKDAESTEMQSWAEQAKMRANKTASSYNNYVLKNSFIWQDNIPTDIASELAYID